MPEKTYSPSWLIFVVVAAVLLVLFFANHRNGGWDERIDCDPLGREVQRTDLK